MRWDQAYLEALVAGLVILVIGIIGVVTFVILAK
jgi:preprotein translocase subunit Sss1